MRAWLIEVAGDPCGAVCDMQVDGLIRLKNLVIRPDDRRRGLGVAAALSIGEIATEQGVALGSFALHGSCGERVYRRAGMRPAVRQTEWYRPLPEKP